jgi:2,3-diketo-5-methylthio-1-phosphopentane phosphatase
VTVRLGARGVGCVLLDIEGTTTPISFVHDVLFRFAREHLDDYLRAERGSPEVRDVVDRLIAEHAGDVERGESPPPRETGDVWLSEYVRWLMDRDRKSPGLKLLQGHIWEGGYRAGQLRGQVFPDVPPAIRQWRDSGIEVAIYSSGSELAQRRLFESIEGCDLMPLISAFFDTAVGAKVSADSYRAIARARDRDPASILFVSDVTAELTAARGAGLQVLLSIRPGNAVQPGADQFETVTSFDEITVGQ